MDGLAGGSGLGLTPPCHFSGDPERSGSEGHNPATSLGPGQPRTGPRRGAVGGGSLGRRPQCGCGPSGGGQGGHKFETSQGVEGGAAWRCPMRPPRWGTEEGARFQRCETKSKGAHRGQLPPLCSAGGVGLGCYQIGPGWEEDRSGGGGGLGTRAAVLLTLILTLGCPFRSNQGAVLSPERTPGLTRGFFKSSPRSMPSRRESCALST